MAGKKTSSIFNQLNQVKSRVEGECDRLCGELDIGDDVHVAVKKTGSYLQLLTLADEVDDLVNYLRSPNHIISDNPQANVREAVHGVLRAVLLDARSKPIDGDILEEALEDMEVDCDDPVELEDLQAGCLSALTWFERFVDSYRQDGYANAPPLFVPGERPAYN